MPYERKKILIWGMTYPQLSGKYVETVCTGGMLENGKPIRLYPIPYRYLKGEKKFRLYEWIEAEIEKNTSDPRPESYKIKPDSIRVVGRIKPNPQDGWAARKSHMFNNPEWQFNNMDDLVVSNSVHETSIGVVRPKNILGLQIVQAGAEDRSSFREKMNELVRLNEIDSQQARLFQEDTPREILDLEFMDSKLQIHWDCNSPNCGTDHATHKMQVFDWGLMELQRKLGVEVAMDKLSQVINPNEHDIKFFLGNLHRHPRRFTIVGLWYPKIVAQQSLL